MGGDAQLLAAGHVAGLIAGGEHHDHGAGKRRVAADRLGQGEAAHVGHVGVGEHQAIGLPLAVRLPQGLEGIAASRRTLGLHPPALEDLFEDQAIGGVVVDHQHSRVVDGRRTDVPLFAGFFLGQLEPGREVEGAAAADFAFDPDPPSHEVHQPRGDRQSQAGAAETAGGRAVGLLEDLEDHLLLLRRHADARIADGEVQHDLAVAHRFRPDLEHDLAALGELDGVAHQVDDDLPQAGGIAAEKGGHVGTNPAGQFQALAVGAHRQRPHRVAQVLVEVEVDAIQHDLARLDLGEVEDVVDQTQQGFSRFGDDLEEVALAGGELGVEDAVPSCR